MHRIAAVLTALALLTCGARTAVPAQPRALNVAQLIEPKSLTPTIMTTLPEGDVTNLLFDGLIRIDEHGRAVPDLALEVPTRANGGISADGKTLTYHLAPNARWHDGVPVTAADVVFTWRAIMNPSTLVATRDGYDHISEVRALDAHTVQVRFPRAYAPAIYLFSAGITGAIVPQHLLGRFHDLNRVAFSTNPVGSGPYRFVSWRHGDRIELTANEGYFRGRPSIERIVLHFIPDLNTLLTQLRTHEADFSDDLDPNQYAEARANGLATSAVPTNGFRHLQFNLRRAPVDDVRVRRALCMALDPHAMYDKLFFRLGALAPADQNPVSGWANPNVHYYLTDPAGAGRLLDEAGWKMSSGGFRAKDGRRLTVELSTVAGAKSNEQVEVALQEAWRTIGVQTEIKNTPGDRYFAPANAGGTLNGGNYEIALFSWVRNPDPNDAPFLSPNDFPPHGENISFYRNDEATRLIAEGVETYDTRRRHAIYDRLQAIIVRDLPYYTLLWIPTVSAYDPHLSGVAVSPIGYAFWNASSWRWRS